MTLLVRSGSGLARQTGVILLLALAACSSSRNAGSDASTTNHDSGVGGDASLTDLDATTGDGGGGGATDASADAGMIARKDPYVAQWPIPPFLPDQSQYETNVDAGVVRDKTTGLLWTYDLVNVGEVPDAGPDAGTDIICPDNEPEARAACSSVVVGGQSGWRLPSRLEFLSILYLDSRNVHQPASFTDTIGGAAYWVATSSGGVTVTYDDHYFPHGFAGLLGATACIRCVKEPFPVTDVAQDAPAGRWVVTASTALDAVTHLEWILHPPNMTYLWNDASTYCAGLPANLSSASAKAWRLPHVKELFALWNEKAKGEEPSVFGAPPQLNYYWADELYRYAPGQVNTGDHHYRVTFDPMDRRIFWENNQDFAKARCVRDAP